MVPPPQIRVLRCCSCRLFQAHQVKKNRKWTCKACGEKQSFLREKPLPSENRWLKYLERGSEKVGLEEGVCFSTQPTSATKMPYSPNTSLPRKRRWSQSTAQPPCIPSGQDLGNSEDTLETQKDHAGLAELVGEGSCCKDWDTREFTGPWGGPPCPAQWNGYKGLFFKSR
uniref:MRN complex interacting protein n=1 Tax=Rousettus aegyptiacus TaxID=9407 RepID=A0A7J8FJU7_ROUAE|nr:MRN complex interacting protein [Rousettus aegyptiacus]